ncbi:MAG TPA: hypothetical protein VHL34_08065 [Rhizomicrobium sp.]|nr:hypothetical protein [Rhizomicrobium sp.]
MTKARDAVVTFQNKSDTYQDCLNHAIVEHRNNPPLFSRLYDDGFEANLEDQKDKNQQEKERVVSEFNAGVRLYNSMHP